MKNIQIIKQIPFDYEEYFIIKDLIYYEILEKKYELDILKDNHPNSHRIESLQLLINKLEKVFAKVEDYKKYFL